MLLFIFYTTFSELGLYLTFIPRIDHYLPFHHSQTSSFSIQGSICEPQGCRHMLDKAHGLSILNLWNAHPLNITLLSHLHLLLLGGRKGQYVRKKLKSMREEITYINYDYPSALRNSN